MKMKLEPFKPVPDLQFSLEGEAFFDCGVFRLDYRWSGDARRVDFGDGARSLSRKMNLWEKTCFEAFLGNRGEKEYWEFNCSPSLEWNVFHFEGERQGMKAELRVPPPELFSEANFFRAIFDLRKLPLSELEVSLTSVIALAQGSLTYWAWKHTAPQADFHRRESFLPLKDS